MKFFNFILVSFIIIAAVLLTEKTFCKKMTKKQKDDLKKQQNNKIIYKSVRNNSTQIVKHRNNIKSNYFQAILSRIGKKRDDHF
jgi:hypothetical protein